MSFTGTRYNKKVISTSRPELEGTRLFVVFTLEEALAIAARTTIGLDLDARVRGLNKIRTAIEAATPPAVSPAPARQPMSAERAAVLRQRDKAYRPIAAPKCRVAKAPLAAKNVSINIDRPVPAPAVDDDYVPWRDEAGGIYK